VKIYHLATLLAWRLHLTVLFSCLLLLCFVSRQPSKQLFLKKIYLKKNNL
jgi:hypothetical protein